MPYLFALLVAANAAALGYFVFLDSDDKPDASLSAAQATLTSPVNFTNKSSQIPPEIGEK